MLIYRKYEKKCDFIENLYYLLKKNNKKCLILSVLILQLNAQDCQFDRGTTAAHL